MRNVHELTQEELEELRSRYYYQGFDDGSLEEVFGKEVECEEDIPMDLVKSRFIMHLFTDEDFFCNLSEDIESPVSIKHNKLRAILQKYGNPEWGDCIIDEICTLFNFPLTSKE